MRTENHGRPFLDLQHEPTPDKLRAILATCNDAEAHHVIWVDQRGRAYVEPVPHALSPRQMIEAKGVAVRFRMETLQRGNGYVGPDASKDERWVSHVFCALVNAWAGDARGHVEVF